VLIGQSPIKCDALAYIKIKQRDILTFNFILSL